MYGISTDRKTPTYLLLASSQVLLERINSEQ